MAMAMAMARAMMREVMKKRRACSVEEKRFWSAAAGAGAPPPPPGMGLIESEEALKGALKKVEEQGLSAMFYYTAAWCGPCRLISPVVETLIKRHPNLYTFKVDIDHESLGNLLSQLDITAVPTFHFYHKGLKVDQIMGADQLRLKTVMDTLYNNN